jgi:hypothetical protein
MTPDGMPIDLPVAPPEGRPIARCEQCELVLERAFHSSAGLLRAMWTEPSLRDRWLDLRRQARFTITQHTPACVRSLVTDGVYMVHIEACFHEDESLARMQVRFRPVEPVTTGLLIAIGFLDLWEERLYRIADILADLAPQQ